MRNVCQLDFAWLDKLYVDLGSSPAFMERLAADYREAGELFLSAVADRADAEVVRDLAHSLAGASGLLGIRRVLEAAKAVEADPTQAAVARLGDLLPVVLDELDAWVATGFDRVGFDR